MLIAVVMSATVQSSVKSLIAMINMPNIPSVPLISAKPSLASSSIGLIPAAASALAVTISTPLASWTRPSPISAKAQWERGARSPLQPSEPNSGTTGVIPALSRSQ